MCHARDLEVAPTAGSHPNPPHQPNQAAGIGANADLSAASIYFFHPPTMYPVPFSILIYYLHLPAGWKQVISSCYSSQPKK